MEGTGLAQQGQSHGCLRCNPTRGRGGRWWGEAGGAWLSLGLGCKGLRPLLGKDGEPAKVLSRGRHCSGGGRFRKIIL